MFSSRSLLLFSKGCARTIAKTNGSLCWPSDKSKPLAILCVSHSFDRGLASLPRHKLKEDFDTPEFKESNHNISSISQNHFADVNHWKVQRESKKEYATPKLLRTTVTSQGNTFDVTYIDVGPRDGPVVAGIHGIGFAKDFDSLLEPLVSAGVRFVAPNFPDTGITTIEDESKFSHNCRDRAIFFVDFLKAIGIHRDITVISHSQGWVPLLQATTVQSEMFKAVVMLSNGGHAPYRMLRPYWIIQSWDRLLTTPGVGKLIEKTLPFMYNSFGFKYEVESALKMWCWVLSRCDFAKAKDHGQLLQERKVPTLFIFTKKDKVIQWSESMKMVKILSTPDRNLVFYDKEGETKHDEPDHNRYPKAIVFEVGKHYIHRSYPRVIASEIARLIRSTEK